MNYKELLSDLIKRRFETTWFEFKENWYVRGFKYGL